MAMWIQSVLNLFPEHTPAFNLTLPNLARLPFVRRRVDRGIVGGHIGQVVGGHDDRIRGRIVRRNDPGQ